jgi:hypothetical protein
MPRGAAPPRQVSENEVRLIGSPCLLVKISPLRRTVTIDRQLVKTTEGGPVFGPVKVERTEPGRSHCQMWPAEPGSQAECLGDPNAGPSAERDQCPISIRECPRKGNHD